MKNTCNIIALLSLGIFIFSCASEEGRNKTHTESIGSDKKMSSFEVYIEPLLIEIRKEDYNSAREELRCLQNLSIMEDSIVFAEIYSYFDTKLRLAQDSIDESEIQLISEVLYLYQDSISKVDIDYLLSPAEPYTVTVTDISYEVEPDNRNRPSFLAN